MVDNLKLLLVGSHQMKALNGETRDPGLQLLP